MKKIIVLIVVVILIVFAAFRLKSNYDKNTTQTDDISYNEVSVSVANVIKKSSSLELNLTGELIPFKELDIASEAEGKITSVNFELGTFLQKGGVLANIDDKIKTLNYKNAKVEAERLRKDMLRIENLYKGGTSTEQEYDKIVSAYDIQKNKVDETERQLAYTKITTSISGIITKKNIEEGTYVKTGAVIASIVDISRLKVQLYVSESNVYFLKLGQKVKTSADIYPGVNFDGKITFISPAGNEAHNYLVEIEMSNSTVKPLKAGTFVNVNIKIDSNKDGLFIPREALQGSVKDAKVYVAENGKAKLKTITVESSNNNYLEVISGIKETDKIIISGQVNLADNKSIKIINN
ncbi:MAG: efflux RND transporter periplasmic adaptor subunit [bacterium]